MRIKMSVCLNTRRKPSMENNSLHVNSLVSFHLVFPWFSPPRPFLNIRLFFSSRRFSLASSLFTFFFFFVPSLIRNENYSESMNARRNNRIYRPRQWRIHLEIAVSTFHSARSPVLDLVYVYARYPCGPNFCFNSLAAWLRAKESG